MSVVTRQWASPNHLLADGDPKSAVGALHVPVFNMKYRDQDLA